MKFVIFVIVVLAFAAMPAKSDDGCTDKNIEFIEQCFKSSFNNVNFNDMNAEEVFQTYNETRQNLKGVDEICLEMKFLKACLQNDTSVVKNCLNAESLLNLDFVKNDTYYAQLLMTIMFETDYSCNSGYEVLSKNFDCIKEVLDSCEHSDDKCDAKWVTCVAEMANVTCGGEAECYVYKDASINVCFDANITCGYCDTLDYNKNPFDKLCNTDIYTTTLAPTTTTPTIPAPTTTTSKNGATNVQKLSFLTVILMIGVLIVF